MGGRAQHQLGESRSPQPTRHLPGDRAAYREPARRERGTAGYHSSHRSASQGFFRGSLGKAGGNLAAQLQGPTTRLGAES